MQRNWSFDRDERRNSCLFKIKETLLLSRIEIKYGEKDSFMKKGFILLLLILVFMTACSSNSDGKADGNQSKNGKNSKLTTEVLHTYKHETAGNYSFWGIKTDSEAKAVVFSATEEIDRVSDYYTYVVGHNDKVFNCTELAKDKESELGCVDENLSPNGNYLLYNSFEDGIIFSIYDLKKEKTIYQVPDPDIFSEKIFGISDDLTVYLETSSPNGDDQLSLYDVKTKKYKHYGLEELLGEEMPSLDKVIPTDDGKQLLIDTVVALYIFNTETEEIKEIVKADSYQEKYDNNYIFIYDSRISPDGKYLYYNVRENTTTDPVYNEYFFHNLETGEVDVYGEFDYRYVHNFDKHGNLLLEGNENLYLYNLDSGKTRIIPEIETGVYAGAYTLSHNGKFLLYTDKESNEDDTYTQYLYRVSLGDINSYETAKLKAKKERKKDEPGQDKIALYDASLNEASALLKLWENSTSVMYPTEFPETVRYITNHHSGNPSDERYTQTIYLETDSYKREKIEFSALKRTEGFCPLSDELELIETIDRKEYYFYAYGNSDVEAAVATENFCYLFDAEDYTKDEMMSIAKSLKPIESVFHDIPVDELKFPTKLPIKNPKTNDPRVISYRDGEGIDYLIEYRGDRDNDIKMGFEIRNSEPDIYMSENLGSVVEIEGWKEAYYSEEYMELHLYDGKNYYVIELEITNDMLDAYGSDHVKETFIEIGKSIK